MHTINRPAEAPPELVSLAVSGSEDFGPLARPLDDAFGSVCAYCERATRDDDADLNTRFFTCDHFKPRHLLCHRDHDVGRCADCPPPHTPDCPIYDWDNLVYACRSCADAKGGQWPRPGESADGYINPAAEPDTEDAPNAVFTYDINSGVITVSDDIIGVIGNNARRTIDDFALNRPRGPKHQYTRYAAKARRINLAELRSQRVKRLRETLDAIAIVDPGALPYVIGNHINPGCRFSSICLQFIQESEYREYLTPASESAAQNLPHVRPGY